MKSDHEMYQSLLSRYDEYQEKKKKRFRIIRFTAPAIACFCLAVSFGIGYYKNYVRLDEIAVKPIADNTTETQSTAVSTTKQSVTTVTAKTTMAASVAMTEKAETQPPVSDIAEYEPDTESDHEILSEAETSVPTEQTEKTVVSTTAAVTTEAVTAETAPTEDVTEPTFPDDRDSEVHTVRLLDSDDPLTIFSNISFDGMDLEGYRYISAERFGRYYISWTEETTVTTYDAKRDREVSEPVTVCGLRDREDYQEYVIVSFENYGMYGLYGVVEEETLIDNE